MSGQKYLVSTSLVPQAEERQGYFGRILRIRGPWQTMSHFWGGFFKQHSEQRHLSSVVQHTGCAVGQPQRWRLPRCLSSLPAPGKPRGSCPPAKACPSGPAILAALSPEPGPCQAAACQRRAVPGSSTSWSWQPRNTATALLCGEGEGLRDSGTGQSSPTASPQNTAVRASLSQNTAPCPQPTGA